MKKIISEWGLQTVTKEDVEQAIDADRLCDLTILAAQQYDNTELPLSMSWAEIAEKLGRKHPLYPILTAAEKRWYELEA